MHRIKSLFDPEGLLNPGVLLNRRSRQVHINESETHAAGRPEIVDLCIECGFLRTGLPGRRISRP